LVALAHIVEQESNFLTFPHSEIPRTRPLPRLTRHG
jgi:hypothetical protein